MSWADVVVTGKSPPTLPRYCTTCECTQQVPVDYLRTAEITETKVFDFGESGGVVRVFLPCHLVSCSGKFFEWDYDVWSFGGLCADDNQWRKEFDEYRKKEFKELKN